MNRVDVSARDRGLGLISRINRWLIAGAVSLSGLLSLAAASSFRGHHRAQSTHSSAVSRVQQQQSSGGGGDDGTGSGSLQQPAQAPIAAPAASGAVSGGSRDAAAPGPAMILVASAGSSAYWYLTRGTGIVALVLLTLSVALGVADVRRLRTEMVPRFVFDAVHRSASLLAVAFTAVHVVISLLDRFAPIRLIDVIIPFTAPYRRSGSASSYKPRPRQPGFAPSSPRARVRARCASTSTPPDLAQSSDGSHRG